MEYWSVKQTLISEALVPHLEAALELLNMPCGRISGIKEIERNGRHVFIITYRFQENEQFCTSNINIEVCKDKPFYDQNYIEMAVSHPNFPENMYFFFEFDEIKLKLNIPMNRKLELNLSDDEFSILASRKVVSTDTRWSFEVSKRGNIEKFNTGNRKKKQLFIEKELAPYLEALRKKLFEKYVINSITEENCDAENSVLKVGQILRSEINDVSTHKVQVKFSDDTLSREIDFNFEELKGKHFAKSLSQISTDICLPEPNKDIWPRNATVGRPAVGRPTVDSLDPNRDFVLKFQNNSNKLVALIQTKHFKGLRFGCGRFIKYMRKNEANKAWQLEISRIDSYKFGASEELTKYLVCSDNQLRVECLPVITIKTKDEYLKTIFRYNSQGCCSKENIRLVRIAIYIFKWDLKDFWVYGLYGVCAGHQWPWTDNEGRYCKPPNNSDTKYDKLFLDFEPASIHYFAEAVKGNFCSEFLNTIREPRLAQLILALVLAEPIRNWETLNYNEFFSQRRMIALCTPNFLKNYHPMVLKGSFQNKKTSLHGNNVSQKKWRECQEKATFFEDDFVACTVYRYHLVLPKLNDVAFHKYYLYQRKKAICKRFSSDDSDMFVLFQNFSNLHRNTE